MERDRDPFKITGLVVQFLRSRFFTGANIGNPDLKGYLWSADDAASRILIEPAFRYKTRDVGRRPAYLVARQQVAAEQTALSGSRMTMMSENRGGLTGVCYNMIVKGSHQIACVGQTGAEAEALAIEAFYACMEFAPVLKSEGALGRLSVDGMGPLQKIDENQENLSVVVSLSWAYTHSWTLSQTAPILKSIIAVN
jgi:hypothetical protein